MRRVEDFFGKRAYKACNAAEIVQFFIVFAADKIHFTVDLLPYDSEENLRAILGKNS